MNLNGLESPKIQYVCNEAGIGKHTELVMLSDPALRTLEMAIAKEKAARDLDDDMALKRERDAAAKKDSAVLAEAAAAMHKRQKR